MMHDYHEFNDGEGEPIIEFGDPTSPSRAGDHMLRIGRRYSTHRADTHIFFLTDEELTDLVFAALKRLHGRGKWTAA